MKMNMTSAKNSLKNSSQSGKLVSLHSFFSVNYRENFMEDARSKLEYKHCCHVKSIIFVEVAQAVFWQALIQIKDELKDKIK